VPHTVSLLFSSTSLSEEGAQIVGFKLVEQGDFMEDGIRAILAKSRNLPDNLADLRAQVNILRGKSAQRRKLSQL